MTRSVYCFWSFVIVFTPSVSETENSILSPTCRALKTNPSRALKSSPVVPVFAPTVPVWVC
jgi:hypothetical protein